MRRTRLFRTASFRLAALYLALFAASTVALSAFVYWSIRHEILTDFDKGIAEERDALEHIFASRGRDALASVLDARAASGGRPTAGLWGPDGQRLGGDMELPPLPAPRTAGWFDFAEMDRDQIPEREPETLRVLATRLSGGSILIVGDERRRSDEILRRVITAFAWALGATIALGVAGGLWLSAQFLHRIDLMRRAAQGIMAGDWSRRIPLATVDDDLSALARTFNRLFGRVETLLLANKHVSADIAHDLRKPLSRVLRRLETAPSGEGGRRRPQQPSRAQQSKSKASSRPSTRSFASGRSKRAHGARGSRSSTSLRLCATWPTRFARPPKSKAGRSSCGSTRPYRYWATRNSSPR